MGKKGNNYWQFRGKHGRNHIYTPEALWNEFVEYAKWVEDHPLKEQKGFAYQGTVNKKNFTKARVMTQSGFCLYADICEETFRNYKTKDDFIEVTRVISNGIRTNKFELAAAELINANIIARDLGIADKRELTSPDGSMSPEQTDLSKLSKDEQVAYGKLKLKAKGIIKE